MQNTSVVAKMTSIKTTVLTLVLTLLLASGVPFVSASERNPWERPGCHLLGHSRKLSIPGCAEFTVTTNACRGFCESWAFPAGEADSTRPVVSMARCCSIMDSETITVNILCLDGERNITMKSATSCDCFHCHKG